MKRKEDRLLDNRITLDRFEVIPEHSTIHNINLKVIFGDIDLDRQCQQ